jgi:glycosyltransferase involved in cell wall biosynthesis
MRTTLSVTVVTPAYNRAKLILRALESVRGQSHWPERVIVVDDKSTDGTPDVVKRWAAETGFPVVVDVLSENGGPAVARNRGIQLATTEYVAFLDSDDEQRPQTLARLVAMLEAVPDAVVSFVDGTIVTPTQQKPMSLFCPHVDLERDTEPVVTVPGAAVTGVRVLRDATGTLLYGSIIPTSGTCFRRQAALAAGLMPANFRSGEDWLFWLRMSMQGRFVFQLEDLTRHHRHDENLTHARAAEFVSREKVRGFLGLEQGTLGVTLSDAQRRDIAAMRVRTVANWRYHLSRLGLAAYVSGLSAHWLGPTGCLAFRLGADPRSLLRAAYCSVKRGPAD